VEDASVVEEEEGSVVTDLERGRFCQLLLKRCSGW
jgi:hypothetical protein